MSEREIVKKLFESKSDEDLDEKTYTVGNKQYWKRNGVCYCWDPINGKEECSEDEYIVAISGGESDDEDFSVDNEYHTVRPDTEARVQSAVKDVKLRLNLS